MRCGYWGLHCEPRLRRDGNAWIPLGVLVVVRLGHGPIPRQPRQETYPRCAGAGVARHHPGHCS